MNYLNLLAENFLLLLNAMSIYILIGLLFAGILKQLIPDNFIKKHLGKGTFSSVLKATALGTPLPICSCSVIPLAQSLRKEGASKGAVQSFLISSPITGVDSILATYSFFGIVFTIFRLISSVIIAILVGFIQNISQKEEEQIEVLDNNSCCTSSSCCSSSNTKKSFSIKEAFLYAYGILFKDMVKPLFLGLLLGTLFTTFAPKEYTSLLFDNQILTYFVIMIFAMPLYVCATASLPIAASFVMLGMSSGAAFIFLTAGPATSAVTMSVVYKMLGKKSLFIYTFSIMALSLLFAFMYDTFLQDVELISLLSKDIEEYSVFSQLSSMIILLLIFYYLLVEKYFKKKEDSCYSSNNIEDKSSNNLTFTQQKVNNSLKFKVKK